MSSIKLHIPLAQYEFLEYEIEGTVEEAIEETIKVKKLYEIKQGEEPGLSEKDFQKMVDKYLTSETLQMEDIDNLNRIQKYWLDVTRRALARIKNRQ